MKLIKNFFYIKEFKDQDNNNLNLFYLCLILKKHLFLHFIRGEILSNPFINAFSPICKGDKEKVTKIFFKKRI